MNQAAQGQNVLLQMDFHKRFDPHLITAIPNIAR